MASELIEKIEAADKEMYRLERAVSAAKERVLWLEKDLRNTHQSLRDLMQLWNEQNPPVKEVLP